MLTTAQLSRLDRLKNYRTRYELTITDGALTYLLGYSEGRARRNIMARIDAKSLRIVALLGDVHARVTFAKRAGDGATIGEWRVRFTGQTERDCVITGEFQHIDEVIVSPEIKAAYDAIRA